jgi:hypothetical protein
VGKPSPKEKIKAVQKVQTAKANQNLARARFEEVLVCKKWDVLTVGKGCGRDAVALRR